MLMLSKFIFSGNLEKGKYIQATQIISGMQINKQNDKFWIYLIILQLLLKMCVHPRELNCQVYSVIWKNTIYWWWIYYCLLVEFQYSSIIKHWCKAHNVLGIVPQCLELALCPWHRTTLWNLINMEKNDNIKLPLLIALTPILLHSATKQRYTGLGAKAIVE